MRKNMGLDGFLKRARDVHGDYYDYSKVEYKNTKTKVCIICPEHGEFWQKPEKHMAGQGCPLCSSKKIEETNLQRYGVRRPLQSKEIYQRMEQTNLDHYGVRCIGSMQSVQEKRKATVREKYGVDYSCQAESVKAKRIATNMRKYGGPSPFSSDEVYKKARGTFRLNRPVSDVVKKPKGKTKPIIDIHSVDMFYDSLVSSFGESDVVRMYESEEYNHAFAFYVKSRGLYIDIDMDFSLDSDLFLVFSDYRLNYVVFHNQDLSDAKLWFSLGCPDGQDWECAYSWLPNRVIKGGDASC